MDLDRAIGRIEGAIEANNKSIDEKFTLIMSELKDLKKKDSSLDLRLTSLEIDRKVVTRIAGVVGVSTSIITTSLITLVIRLIT